MNRIVRLIAVCLTVLLLFSGCGGTVTRDIGGYKATRENGVWSVDLSDLVEASKIDFPAFIDSFGLSVEYSTREDFLKSIINCRFTSEQLNILTSCAAHGSVDGKIFLPREKDMKTDWAFQGDLLSSTYKWSGEASFTNVKKYALNGHDLTVWASGNKKADRLDALKNFAENHSSNKSEYTFTQTVEKDGISYSEFENEEKTAKISYFNVKSGGVRFYVSEKIQTGSAEAKYEYSMACEKSNSVWTFRIMSDHQLGRAFFEGISFEETDLKAYVLGNDNILD